MIIPSSLPSSSSSYYDFNAKACETVSSILAVLLFSSADVTSSSSFVDFDSSVAKANKMSRTGMMKNVMLIDKHRNRFRHLVPKHGA